MKKHRPFKAYGGVRRDGQAVVEVLERDAGGKERMRALNPRHDLWNHSPDGFEWGYGGSGPAQLALALLADHFGAAEETQMDAAREKAIALHQDFKFAVVGKLDRSGWLLTSDDIEASVRAIEAKNRLEVSAATSQSAVSIRV